MSTVKQRVGKFAALSIVMAFLMMSLASVLLEPKAYAADGNTSAVAEEYGMTVGTNAKSGDYKLRWIDAAQIEVTFKNGTKVIANPIKTDRLDGLSALQDQRYVDGNRKSRAEYGVAAWGGGNCHFKIYMDNAGVKDQIKSADVDIDFKGSSVDTCRDMGTVKGLAMSSPENSNAYFRWVDQGTIEAVGVSWPGEFVRSTDPKAQNIFLRSSDGAGGTGCQDRLVLSGSTVMFFELDNKFNNDTAKDYPEAQTNCKYNGNPDSYVAPVGKGFRSPVVDSSNNALSAGTGTSTNTTLGTGGDDNVDCDTSGNPLSWILCPIIDGSLNGAQAIFHGLIEPYLQTNPVTTGGGDENVVFTIWKSFRTIGNIVLIFALLFVVFGQSIGGGMVDAYTAKKTIPRILVAAILINLSIYICAIVVDIFNVLGNGMARLILSPVKDTGQLKIRPEGKADIAYGMGAIIAVIISSYAAVTAARAFRAGATPGGASGGASLAQYVMLFIVLPVFLAILAVFITLLMRRAIILLLIIISPIALALFAIPSTDKYAKKWFDAFIKTMVVYPIITGIFAVSQVLAVLTYNTNVDSVGSSFITLIAVMIVAFAPLFMIPFAFKLAGGVIGTVAGAVLSGKDKFKKMYGDDTHNPHSRRNRMKESIREPVRTRMRSGAATIGRGALSRAMGDEAAAAGAANVAGRRAERAANAAHSGTHGGDPARMRAVRQGAIDAAMTASNGGYDDVAIDAAGAAAADAAASPNNYSTTDIAAAGRAAALARSRGYSHEESMLAGSAAARLASANWGGAEVDAGALAAAESMRLTPPVTGPGGVVTPGRPSPAIAAQVADTAASAHSRLARTPGINPEAARMGATAAGVTMQNIINSRPATTRTDASAAADVAAQAAAAAHVEISNNPPTAAGTLTQTQVENASMAAARSASNARLDRAAAVATDPTLATRAGAEAARVYSVTNSDTLADRAGRAVT